MKRALIVGDSGQDGRLLRQRLSARGFEVFGMSRGRVVWFDGEIRPAVDISDPESVARVIRDAIPDQVYYLAAHHRSSQDACDLAHDEWRECWRVHVHGLQSVLDAVRLVNPSASIFFASSSRIYGSGGGCRDERSPIRPECPYGVTKASGMIVASHYRLRHSMSVSSGILFNHESPLRPAAYLSQRVVSGLVAIKKRRSDRLLLGDLEAVVDWGYAPDYVRAMQMIVESGCPGDYVVATGRPHRVLDFVEVAARHLGIDWHSVVQQSGDVLTRPAQGLWGDARLLSERTGWRPEVAFEDMVRLLVDDAMQAD